MHVPARSLASAGIRKSASGLLSQLNRPRLHTSTTAAAASSSNSDKADQMADDQHRHTNRLAKEQSPYLLQHAHNPVSLLQGSCGCIAVPARSLLQPSCYSDAWCRAQCLCRATGYSPGTQLLHQCKPSWVPQVDWYPWGEEALTAAREQQKPIFLSVGYATCHW